MQKAFEFDYGGAVAEQDVHFKLWPTDGLRTALVDADFLPYVVGYTTDTMKYLAAQQAVVDGLVDCIENTQEFKNAFDQLCCTLNFWINDSGCDSAILYCTQSDMNYRMGVAFSDPYKGTRKEDKPPFFYELKAAMQSKLGCILAQGEEADDLLGHEVYRRNQELAEQGVELGSSMHKELCNFVLVSGDKDLKTKSGMHYTPRDQQLRWVTPLGHLELKYKKDSTTVSDLKGDGLKFFYAQMIMGDTIDNYKGIPRKGAAFAYQILNDCKSEKELYMAVLQAYKDKYGDAEHVVQNYRGTEAFRFKHFQLHGKNPPRFDEFCNTRVTLTAYQRMLEQGRLAWIQDKKGEIWREGKGTCPLGDDITAWYL